MKALQRPESATQIRTATGTLKPPGQSLQDRRQVIEERAARSGITDEEFKKKEAQWKVDVLVVTKALNAVPANDEKARAKAIEEYQKVFSRRSEFMHEEMTGFVWLYLQK